MDKYVRVHPLLRSQGLEVVDQIQVACLAQAVLERSLVVEWVDLRNRNSVHVSVDHVGLFVHGALLF